MIDAQELQEQDQSVNPTEEAKTEEQTVQEEPEQIEEQADTVPEEEESSGDFELEQFAEVLSKNPEAQHHRLEVAVAQERGRNPGITKEQATRKLFEKRPDLVEKLPEHIKNATCEE